MKKLAEPSHDPLQFLNQLRQLLAAPKLSIGVFLGAGCPCSIKIGEAKDKPIIPDVSGLTDKVSKEILESEDHKASFTTLLSVLKEDGEDRPNIEAILGRIRALSEVAGKDKARGLSSDELSKLDNAICATITKAVDCEANDEQTPYRSLAKYVRNRVRPATELFTTNYDLLLEQALELERVPYFDGFVGGVRPFFDQTAIDDDKIPERWCRLWKIHGSINWRANSEQKRVVRSRNEKDGDEQLIHPSHRKYDESRRMPYLVMMDRLRAFMRNQRKDFREREPAALITLGYSFSDQHINEAIAESLRTNPSAVCYALQFETLDKYPKAKELALGTANLAVLAKDSAVIRRQAGAWMARAQVEPSSIVSAFAFDKEAEGDEPRPCTFNLGDFAQFGSFLDNFGSPTDSFLGAG